MKRIISIILIGVAMLICLFGCSNNEKAEEKLTGDDLIAYNLMLEVCKVAKDPTDTFVISGTVTSGDTGGALKVKSGNQISYVIITYENGKAVCSDGEEVANYSDEYMKMFTNTSDFDTGNVNRALQKNWGID